MSCFDMEKEYSTVEEQVEYGLERIDPERKIEVSLRDFLYLYNTVGEFVRFFHQPMHYTRLEDVETFMGNRNNGALHLLWEIYYRKFYYEDIFPGDIRQMIDDSELEHPNPPYYYKP